MHANTPRTRFPAVTALNLTDRRHLVRRGAVLTLLLAALTGLQCFSPLATVEVIPLSSVQVKPRVRLTTSKGDIVLELFPQQAPLAVANFLQYVRDGFYDHTLIHQAISGASITAGKYDENLTAKVTRDPIANESNNGLSNVAGRVALVEPSGTGTGTSAFIIRISDATGNDYNLADNEPGLTVFGKIVEGMDIVEIIGGLATETRKDSANNSLTKVPTEDVLITQAIIDTSHLSADNTAPVADAGADQSVQTGGVVILDGSGSSDPDDEAIAFTWRQISGPTVTLSSTDVVRPSFTPDTVARLKFELTVTDAEGATGTDTVEVAVSTAGNHPPTASAGADQTVLAGTTVTLDGSGSNDADFQTITYAWTQTGGTPVDLSSASVASPTFTAPSARGKLTFQLDVTDSEGGTAADTVTITVTSGTSASAGTDQNALVSTAVTLHGSVADGTTLAWTQVSGTSVTLSNTSAAEPTFTAPATSGPLTFRLSSTTSTGAITNDDVTVFVFIQTATGLQYCDVVVGTGTLVESDSALEVLYTGRLTDQNGDVFDSSTDPDNPASFTLSSLIAGWKEGLGDIEMHAGGKRILIIPPDLAYGEAGQGDIPGNATLWFEVEVLTVQ